MPYVTPYSTALPDLDEARLFAIQTMIVASLTDLNTALGRDGLAGGLQIAASQVILGNPNLVPQSLICIVGGGKEDATDMEIVGRGGFMPRSDKSGYMHTLYTNIYVYIGSEELLTDDPIAYVQFREVARARICGHIRKRVFNSLQGVLIQLASQELTTGADCDQLKDAHISSIKKGEFPKGPGGDISIYGAHLLHQGWIA
jgi:hypothetical protein